MISVLKTTTFLLELKAKAFQKSPFCSPYQLAIVVEDMVVTNGHYLVVWVCFFNHGIGILKIVYSRGRHSTGNDGEHLAGPALTRVSHIGDEINCEVVATADDTRIGCRCGGAVLFLQVCGCVTTHNRGEGHIESVELIVPILVGGEIYSHSVCHILTHNLGRVSPLVDMNVVNHAVRERNSLNIAYWKRQQHCCIIILDAARKKCQQNDCQRYFCYSINSHKNELVVFLFPKWTAKLRLFLKTTKKYSFSAYLYEYGTQLCFRQKDIPDGDEDVFEVESAEGGLSVECTVFAVVTDVFGGATGDANESEGVTLGALHIQFVEITGF